ncbi:hypothetical protein D3C81_1492640 [compost metagenome]
MQGLFSAAGRTHVEAIFAVDDQGWNTGDFIFFGQFSGFVDLAFDGERIEGRQEFILVDALCGQEICHVILVGQLFMFFLDRFEHRSMDLVFDTHRFEGQEQLAMCIPRATEHGRDTDEVHVGRQLLGPGIDHWLEGVAMRAAVPEQLYHFDLARYGDRNRIAQFDIRCGGGVSGLGSHAEQAGSGKNGADDQITHALLLDKFYRLARLVIRQILAGLSSVV